MSRQTARVALEQMVGRPALLAPHHAGVPSEVTSGTVGAGLLADMRDLAASNYTEEMASWELRKQLLCEAYGYSPGGQSMDRKPFAFADGKAIIPIHGTLINRFPYSFGYVTGYNFIRNQVAAAEADPDVNGVVFDVNSNGGSVAGCPETGAIIAGMSKPSLAVVDSNCYSAAYWLASQTDKIVSTPSGGVGSIGVVMMHMDVSKMIEDIGIKVTFIHAGEHKVDGNMFEPLTKEVKAALQGEVNALYDDFTATVAEGRGIEQTSVAATEAQIFRAQEALDLGLIDAIQTPSDAVKANFTDNEEIEMNTKTPQAEAALAENNAAGTAAADAAAAAARTAERSRIAGIQGHADAKGREALATHLAMNTNMSVEEAAGILAASPKAAEPKADEGNAFAAAMDKSANPNVGGNPGTNAETTEDGENLTPAQRILANFAKVGVSARSN